MIFEAYKNYFTEQRIDLTKYIEGKKSIDDFHDNFFKEESGHLLDNFTIETIFSFKSKNSQGNTIAERMAKNHVTSVLLILPQSFVNHVREIKIRESGERPRPVTFAKDFMNKFSTDFNNNGIDFSYILKGTQTQKNLENIESWLNTKLLEKEINLNPNEAFLLGFIEMNTTGMSNKAISLNFKNNNVTLFENCSILLANNKLFKYSIPNHDSLVKITNNTTEGYVDISTEGIDTVSTSHERLKEDLSYGIANFSVELKELDKDDIDITFDNTTLFLSKNIIEKKEGKEEIKSKPNPKKEEPNKENSRILINDTDSDSQEKSSINLKNNYLVNLKKFTTPFEKDLIEVHYHLVKIKNQLILVGGNKIDKQKKPIVKVVANLKEERFEVTNTSSKTIEFDILEDKIKYRVRKKSIKPKDINDTDTDDDIEDISEVSIKTGETHFFDKRIEFTSSSIDITENGVEVEYVNFIVGSFNNKLEFGRSYYTHFGTGNIIDAHIDSTLGGRIYTNKEPKIIGSSISRTPLLLTLRENNFNIRNSIKKSYTIHLKTETKEEELAYEEELNISKEALVSKGNHLSISKENIPLIEFSIIAN